MGRAGLDSGISEGVPSEQQSLVQESHYLGRMLSCIVDAPECSYRQRRIHGPAGPCRNVADVHANHAVGEREIIQVIATDEGGRLKFVGDRNTADAQRLSRQHAALSCPGFVQFLLS